MDIIEDKAFGIMEYKYSWKKNDQLSVWGMTFDIFIIANDLDKTGISSAQQNAYLAHKDSFAKEMNAHLTEIVKFCEANYAITDPIIPEIVTHLRPTSIVFQQDGSWGILMDSDYDIENGLVLFFKDGVAKVDVQDVFL